MSRSALSAGLRHLRSQLAAHQHHEDSDEQLLHAFAVHRDESAFAVLVHRHGPMVLHVCRRVLEHEQDAEDAFQATFLVLARKAATLRKNSALASFLHGTAYRLALSAKRAAVRRRKYEGQAPSRSPVDPVAELSWREVRVLLDEEIARLSEKYRSVFILCCLEELSRAEASQRLGLTERTVASRLAEARKRLSQRLSRRGVELTAVLAASTLAMQTASALPPVLLANTAQAALATAAGEGTAGMVSASVAELMRTGSAAASSAKAAMAILLAATLLCGAGVWWGAMPQEARAPRDPAQTPVSAPRGSQKPADSLVLRGRVLGPDNKPVSGAKLYVPRWSKERPQNQSDATVILRGNTDKDGRFTVELPRQEMPSDRSAPLLAAADGFGLAWIDLPREKVPAELTLRLVEDVAIRGRLLTTEGKPVAGATVTVLGLMAFKRLDDFLRVSQRETSHIDEMISVKELKLPLNDVLHVKPTDKDGRFEVKGVGVERLVGIEVKSAAIAPGVVAVVTRESFDAQAYRKSVVRRDGDRTPSLFGPLFEHVVDRAAAAAPLVIEGVVREAGSGKPVIGATVREFGGVAALTDARGHYRLAGRLRELPGSQEYGLGVTASKDVPLIQRQVRVAHKAGPMRADIEMTRGIFIAGRVYDKATGKGGSGSVHFEPLPENKTPMTEGLSFYSQTGDDGRFQLVAIPGPGVLLAQAHTSFKIDGVKIDPYRLAEFDAADRPRIKMTNQFGYRAFHGAGGAPKMLDFYNACKVVDVKDDGTATTFDLALDPGKTRTVRLEDTEGNPLTGAVVAGVSAWTKRAVPLRTDTGRIYALDPKNPRPVAFLHVERKLAAVVTLRGDEKEPVTVRLSPASVLTGRLVDRDGQPVAGVEVFALYKTVGKEFTESRSRWFSPRTDKDGRFRVDAIVPGLSIDLGFLKGRQRLGSQTPLEIKPLQSSQTCDVGDIRVKSRQ